MKVAINARFILPRLEGIGRYTHEIIRHLAVAHPEDEFHIILDRSHHMPFMQMKNVVTHILGPPARHPILWLCWFEVRIPALLKKIQPDVFFSPDGYLSLRTNVPTVLTIHDLAYLDYPAGTQWAHRHYLNFFMPRFVKRADSIISVSKFTAQRIIAHFTGAEHKVETIANGLSDGFKPIDEIRKTEIRDKYTSGRPFFLYLGAIHPRKNVGSLIKAFEAYRSHTEDEICLVLAGRMAWETKEIKRLLSKSLYKKDIIQVTHFDEDLFDLVAAAAALCYLSFLEGFGLPVLEAMASRTPVITSRNSAMKEIGGNAVFYANPVDISDIEQKLRCVRTVDDHLINKLDEGLTRARTFTWSSSAGKIYNLLKEISVRTA